MPHRPVTVLQWYYSTDCESATTSTPFYTAHGKAELIYFTEVTDAQLAALSEACQQATFGVNQQDILDESCRKGGKLDATNFATELSPLTCDIFDTIWDTLLAAEHAGRLMKVELYKLNIYGPRSFFKAYVDTPRSETMFESLVIVLPTIHEGGYLSVRHDGREQVFDTALATKAKNAPHAAFVAFYSDVEHEVALVTSGYRATLTYNLYLANSPTALFNPLPNNDHIEQLKSSLATLLADSKFLPEGGLLGFGLSHRYPVNPFTTKLAKLAERLNGSDVATKRICEALSLGVSLKALYKADYEDGNDACLLDEFADLGDDPIEEILVRHMEDNFEGIMIQMDGGWRGHTPIVWIKPLANSNAFKSTYLAYGNDASVGYTYARFAS